MQVIYFFCSILPQSPNSHHKPELPVLTFIQNLQSMELGGGMGYEGVRRMIEELWC